MPKKRVTYARATSAPNWMGILGTVFSVLLILLGISTLVLIQQPLQESQDIRRSAAVEDGLVEIVTNASLPETAGEVGQITIDINTNQTLTEGVQLSFEIKTDTFNQLTTTFTDDTGMVADVLETAPTEDGFLVELVASPQSANVFSTNDPVRLLELDFVAEQSGSIDVVYDQVDSFALQFESNEDVLKTVADQNYQLTFAGDTTDTTDDDIADNGTGGTTYATCNERCDVNSDCDANLYCYRGSCRRPTNPTSTTCVDPEDQGLSRTCNEYCADTNECADGYTCYNNRCRNPKNITSQVCAEPPVVIREKTVTMITPEETAPPEPKGGADTQDSKVVLEDELEDDLLDLEDELAIDATPAADVFAPTQEIMDEEPPQAPVDPDETALEAVLGALSAKGITLPLLMIVTGVALIILMVIFWLMQRTRFTAPPKPAQATYRPTPQDESHMNNLQSKINALQQPNPHQPMTRPVAPPTPATPPTPPVQPTQPQPEVAAAPPAPNQNSMLNRLENRGTNLRTVFTNEPTPPASSPNDNQPPQSP